MARLSSYPNVIPYKTTKKILEQMEKCICKIRVGEFQETGFFSKIPFPNENNMLPVLITVNHILGQNLINQEEAKIILLIKEESEIKELYLNNRMKYTNEEFDIAIIEIKEFDKISNYLDGKFDKIYGDKKHIFIHKCETKGGSKGSPILGINNKLIGMHIGSNPKVNKGLLLNYPIKEFIKQNCNINNINNNINNSDEIITDLNEIELRKFNYYYSFNIENLKVDKLNFSRKNININFNELFDDVSQFQKFKFEKLEILDLSNNNIENINVFEKVYFRELKNLRLVRNKISDIEVLAKVKFKNLEKLNLSENKINDISILGKSNFKELKELNLSDNNISDIQILGKVRLQKLEILNLSKNNISDISIFKKVDFKLLKELYLNNNYIADIKVFEKAIFNKLEILVLNNNGIDKLKNELIISNLNSKIKEFDI